MPSDALSGASVAEGEQLAALLYGFRATGEPVPHPMNAADGNRMWDALGGGCIDGGSWDDPYPTGKSDIRSPVFCIPQPCVRILSEEELEREVLGRRLEEGEYETYLHRLEETCGELPSSLAADDPGYLQLASLGWTGVLSTSGHVPLVAPVLSGEIAVPTAAARDLLWVRPPARPDRGGFAPRSASGGTSSGGGGGRSAPDGPGGGSTDKPDRMPKPEIESPPSKFVPKPKPDPDTPTKPAPGPETPDPNIPQPSPVPLPAGLPMLVTALAAAFAIRRR